MIPTNELDTDVLPPPAAPVRTKPVPARTSVAATAETEEDREARRAIADAQNAFRTGAKPMRPEDLDPRSANHPLGFWLWQLMGEMNNRSNGQDPSKLSDKDFKNLVDTGINALEALGVAPDTINNIREAVASHGDLFRGAFALERLVGGISRGTFETRASQFYGTGRHADYDGFNSSLALRVAASDDAGGGYCARGVKNILRAMGLPTFNGNANNFDEQAARLGYVRLPGVNPNNAPEGALLFFDNDRSVGKNNRGTGGGSFGHVEMVAKDGNGQTWFVSDKARHNWGGSVPDNFGGAYVRREDYNRYAMAMGLSAGGPAPNV